MVSTTLRESVKDSVLINNARRLFPIPPSLPTIHRWAMSGCRGVVLETWFLGGRRCTNSAAVDRFLAALNTGNKGIQATVTAQNSAQAGKALEALGC